MTNRGITHIPVLYEKARIIAYQCELMDTMIPGQVQASVSFGAINIMVLAPETKVNRTNGTIALTLIGTVGDQVLVSVPGEVEDSGSTIMVPEGYVNGSH